MSSNWRHKLVVFLSLIATVFFLIAYVQTSNLAFAGGFIVALRPLAEALLFSKRSQ